MEDIQVLVLHPEDVTGTLSLMTGDTAFIFCDVKVYFYRLLCVMYGSAGCEKVLQLSRGKVSHIKVHCNTQHLSLGSLVFAHLGSIRETDM